MSGFVTELKRRNVIKVAAFYLVASWLIVQVAETVLPLFDVPESLLRGVVILMAIGFIPVLMFSWIYELTPEGIKKESEIDRSGSLTPATGRKLDIATFVLLGALLVMLGLQQFGPQDSVPLAQEPQAPTTAIAEVQKPDPATPTTQDLSIAVLPFANMSTEAENEYFADGLTEELLNVLAQIKTLKVAGRTSSFYFKGRNENLQSIGAQLNVAHVLEGSVRRSGDRLRITAQLIKVDDGFHLWSHTYDRVLDDVFAIQEEIALAISDALQIELALKPKGLAGQTTNIEAYSAYLLGRQKWNSRAIDQLVEAIDLFRKAVALDPNYALAWSGLADAIDALAYRDQAGVELIPGALEAARRAISLAPDQAAGYASLGILQAEFEWEFEAGLGNLAKALNLNPVYVPALHWKADISNYFGRYDDQLELCDRALMLDPLAIIVLSACGGGLFDSGRDDERAVQMMAKAMKLSPDFVNISFALPLLATTADLMSLDEAAVYLKHWATLRGLNEPERMRVFLEQYSRPELRHEALRLLSEIEAQRKTNPIELFYLYAQVGELERALVLFEALYEIRHPQILASSGNRLLPAALRDHPRFEAVMKKMGLPTRREIETRND